MDKTNAKMMTIIGLILITLTGSLTALVIILTKCPSVLNEYSEPLIVGSVKCQQVFY